MTDHIEALERLAKLHQSGALTDAEFAAQKARLLEGRAEPAAPAYQPAPSYAAEPASSDGVQPLWLLLGALLAVGLGVLLWWTLVDSKGEVKQAPAPGASTSASASASASPAASAAPTPSATAPTLAAAEPKRTTYNPSFSCSGQTDNVLTMICQSRELSAKDRALSDRFKAVLRNLDESDQQALLRSQRDYLRERNRCQDVGCLHDWYDRVTDYYVM